MLNAARKALNAVRTNLNAARTMLFFPRGMLGVAGTMLDAGKSKVDTPRTGLNLPGMTQNQENRATMFGTVSDYMQKDANPAIWTPMKAAVDTLGELDAVIEAIGIKVGKQKTPTGGAAGEKENVRQDYEAKILEIGDQLSSIAAAAKDADMAAQVEFSKAGLGKLPAEDLLTTGKRVSKLAKVNMPALTDHLITAVDVQKLDDLTKDFDEVKNKPRTTIAGRAGETATLPDLLTAGTDLLRDRLDKQMTKFRLTNPEFYAGYQSARVVVDRGGSGPPTPPTSPEPGK